MRQRCPARGSFQGGLDAVPGGGMDAEALPARQQREKARVAFASLLACLVLVAAKTMVGVASNSLGVLSEAASSGLALISAIILYLSAHGPDRSADGSVPGHGKIEYIPVLLKAVLLLFACVWIVREAAARLMGKVAPVEVTFVVFAVLVLGMAVDFFRARAIARVVRAAPGADAPRFSANPWTSLLVLLVRMGAQSIGLLVDSAPRVLRPRGLGAAPDADGVVSVGRVGSLVVRSVVPRPDVV